MTKTVHKIAAACAMAFAVGAAHAATDPVDWDYSFELKWVDATLADGSSLIDIDRWTPNSSIIKWGYYNGSYTKSNATPDRSQSAIVINPVYQPGYASLVTGGDNVEANAFTHYNNKLDASFNTLTNATLQLNIVLTARDGSGYTQAWTQDFDVYFKETENSTGNNAADADIFTITWDGSYSESFTYDGFEYSFNYFENPSDSLQPLLASECAKTQAPANCYGFLTSENKATDVKFEFNIAAQAVPEPETYAMLLAGLGIVGMVARRRRGYIHD